MIASHFASVWLSLHNIKLMLYGGSHELSLNLSKPLIFALHSPAQDTYTFSKVKAKTTLTNTSFLANRHVQTSSYPTFQNEISKEVWISKLARGTHPGAANIFHELSAPDDQINLNEFTYKPLHMVSLSRSLRQF